MAQTPVEPLFQSLPERPTRLAIVGAYLGRARFGAAFAQLPLIKVAGVVDSDARTGRAWARELPGKAAFYSTVAALLQAEQELDGIVIAGALADRASGIDAAVSAGVSVLSEFPYTKTIAQMDRLFTLADDMNSRILPVRLHRYEAAATALNRVLEEGRVGSISRVRCEASFPLGAAYALENGVVPVSIDWYDLLQVVAARTIDLCQIWLGAPESINADIDLPHHAALAGRRASDPVANLIITHARGQSTHLLRLSRSVQPTERYLLHGQRGSAELVRCDGEKLKSGPTVRIILHGTKPETVYAADDPASDFAASSANQLTNFADSVRFGSPALQTSTEARIVMETVQAAFASARDGIRTPLPLAEPVDVDGILEGGG